MDEPTVVQQQSQQHQYSSSNSVNGSPQRVANKRSSITVNMPAAGLGQRPPSIISTASQDESVGVDEGKDQGLKAKLQSPPGDDNQDQPDSLNYVDVGYRLNPDGSESREVFSSEADLYVTAKVSDMQRKFHGANGFVQESSTVYAIIVPDQQQQQQAEPPIATAPRALLQSPTTSVDGSPLHRGVFNSPPVGVVSPIRRSSGQQQCELNGGGNDETCSTKTPSQMSPVKGIAPIASIDPHEEELNVEDEEDEQLAVEYVDVLNGEEDEEEQAPVLPERCAPTLELQDLEYADTSAGEDEEDMLQHLNDNVIDEMIKVHITPAPTAAPAPTPVPAPVSAPAAAPAAATPRDDCLPDAMTAAEAERLLSSR